MTAVQNYLNSYTYVLRSLTPRPFKEPGKSYCCIIGQQTNVDWNALVSNETNTDVRMYT